MDTTDRKPLTISVTEAARLLGISRATAYAAVRNGDIPSINIGKRRMIPRTWLITQLGTDNW